MLILYRIFTFLVYYVTLPFTYLFYRTGSRKWTNRLGYYYGRVEGIRKHYDIWLHASSMGEVKVLEILANQLKNLDKNLALYVTVMTETGFQRVQEMVGDNIDAGYLPLDYRASINRFLNNINPMAAVFIETEIWPNIILESGKRRIALFLANGRLSEKSCRNYRWFKSGLRKVFGNYKLMMVQSETDKERLKEIGAREDRINVLGNLKFDAPVNVMSSEQKAQIRDSLPFCEEARIFIAGSTRNGEHQIILNIFVKLLKVFGDVRLILAPRHLDKIDQICRMLRELNLGYYLYSNINVDRKDTSVLVIDRMGILSDLYAISDIAFVGGTLVDTGGHNVLEPVWAGVPVVFGLSTYNVQESSDYIIEERFGEMVQDGEDLYRKLNLFFNGKLEYRKKSSAADEQSRTYRTARIILESIQNRAKYLAESNNTQS